MSSWGGHCSARMGLADPSLPTTSNRNIGSRWSTDKDVVLFIASLDCCCCRVPVIHQEHGYRLPLQIGSGDSQLIDLSSFHPIKTQGQNTIWNYSGPGTPLTRVGSRAAVKVSGALEPGCLIVALRYETINIYLNT